MVIWNVFVAFARANLLGYGGGPSIVPLFETEIVRTYGWMTKEEFGEALALGNTLPGPIATKLSAFVGYRVAGIPGALAGLAGTVLPTAVLMVVLLTLLSRFRHYPFVQGMMKGAKPVVFVLLAVMAADFFRFAFGQGWLPFVIGGGYFLAVQYLGVHPGMGMAAALLAGGMGMAAALLAGGLLLR